MSNRAIGLLIAAAVAIFLLTQTFYTVDPTKQVLVRQFGALVGAPKTEPGLYMKIPLVQDIVRIDRRLLDYEADEFEIIAGDQKRLVVDAYARFKIVNARQQKVGWPTLDSDHWDLSVGTFMLFTVDRVPGCSAQSVNHGYAVWNSTSWVVQYGSDGCPKLFTSAQAAFPFHSGGVKYRLYYGDPSLADGRTSANLPFLGPKKLIYGDGSVSGSAGVVDFEDWEAQASARDVVFLWPNGDELDAPCLRRAEEWPRRPGD